MKLPKFFSMAALSSLLLVSTLGAMASLQGRPSIEPEILSPVSLVSRTLYGPIPKADLKILRREGIALDGYGAIPGWPGVDSLTCGAYISHVSRGWQAKSYLEYKHARPFTRTCGALEIIAQMIAPVVPRAASKSDIVQEWHLWPASVVTDILESNDFGECGLQGMILSGCAKALGQKIDIQVNDEVIRIIYGDIERTLLPAIRGDYNADGYDDLAVWQETVDMRGTYKDFRYICLLGAAEGAARLETCFEGPQVAGEWPPRAPVPVWRQPIQL